MPHKKDNAIIVDETVNNLRRLFQVVNEQSKQAVHDSGLSGSQLWALKVLHEETGKLVTVSGLARRMCLNSSTVVRLLDGLEQKAFVQRERSISDRRIVHVSMTEKGAELVRQAPEVAQTILGRGLSSLSDHKLYNISIGLAQLVNILDSH